MAEAPANIYPVFSVENAKNPNRFLNFPILGILIKLLLVLPIGIELIFLYFASIFVLVINWFVISFTGNYWNAAYKLFVGIITLETKVALYLFAITDTYPGFKFDTKGLFTLTITKPEKPSKWLAIPILGIFVRVILALPYLFFITIMQQGSRVALLLSWFVILFKKRLPESLFEFERDWLRVSIAGDMYILGLSDKYPNFHIAMTHQTAKILLLIAGTILAISDWAGALDPAQYKGIHEESKYQQQMDYDQAQYDSKMNYDYESNSYYDDIKVTNDNPGY